MLSLVVISLPLTPTPYSLSLQYKVTHKQLVLLLGAFAAYFSGNHQAVEAQLTELKAKLSSESQAQDSPAWLEELPGSQEFHNQDH